MRTQIMAVVLACWAVTATGVQHKIKVVLNKDARLFVERYEQHTHITANERVEFESGDFRSHYTKEDDDLEWDDDKGGKEPYTLHEVYSSASDGSRIGDRTTENVWPATLWPKLPVGSFTDSDTSGEYENRGAHPPVLIWQYRDQKPQQNYSFMGYDPFYGTYSDEGYVSGTVRAQMKITFRAGGMDLPTRPIVYIAGASAYAKVQTGVDLPYKGPQYESRRIPSQNVSLGDLGPLDEDGILYTIIQEGSTVDVTPTVKGNPYYTFTMPVLSKYTLVSQVVWSARTDSNPERTNLGVGESVNLKGLPDETKWTSPSGSLSTKEGAETKFTAPAQGGKATITATIRKIDLIKEFDVKEPSGYAPTYTFPTSPDCYPLGLVGAGMHLQVVIAPTDVSFGAVIITEVGRDASGQTDWYTHNGAPSHIDHGADQRIYLDNLNTWPDHAWGTSDGNWLNWVVGDAPGTFSWDVPVDWQVGISGSKKRISGWSQTFDVRQDGTVIVTKFGHTATRSPRQVCSSTQ